MRRAARPCRPNAPTPATRYFFCVLFRVVLAQQVVAEVAFEFADGRVDVVSVALRVIELDQERRALNAVIGLLAAVQPPGPGERDFVEAGGVDFRERFVGELRPASGSGKLFTSPTSFSRCGGVQLGGGDADGRERLDALLVRRDDFLQRLLRRRSRSCAARRRAS